MTDGLAAQDRPELEGRTSGTLPAGTTAEAHAWRLRGLVSAHFDFIWRSLRRMGLQAADADDATQEVFCVASRRLEDIAPEHERSFLFGTALRVVALHRRTARRREARIGQLESLAPTAQSLPTPEDLAGLRRARTTLDRLLDELVLEERAVFVLFELEELSVPEIAELCELKAGTVASRLRRAREAFRAAAHRHRAREHSLHPHQRGDR